LDNVLGINNEPQILSPSKASFAQIGLIVDKLRRILNLREIRDVRELFNGREMSNLVEFKNIIKKLGMTNSEIEKLYEALTPGQANEYTGLIDLNMLSHKIARTE